MDEANLTRLHPADDYMALVFSNFRWKCPSPVTNKFKTKTKYATPCVQLLQVCPEAATKRLPASIVCHPPRGRAERETPVDLTFS